MNNIIENTTKALSIFANKSAREILNHGDIIKSGTLIQPLIQNGSFVGYKIGRVSQRVDHEGETDRRIFSHLRASHNVTELKMLCFELAMEYENLPIGEEHLEFVRMIRRNGKTEVLLQKLEQQRPHIEWRIPAEFAPANEIALVVSASRRPFEDAVNHMAKITTDCHFYLFTNDFVQNAEHNRLLSVAEGWNSHVQIFSQFCGKIPLSQPIHFFFAGPAQLAFMFGCAFGTVHTGHKVYHYQPRDENNQKYVQVGTIARNWKI